MGVVETSFCLGQIYFNVYPNLTLSLTDRNIGLACNLKILTTRYNFLPGSEMVAILYRIYYKVMNTLAPNIKHISNPSGFTTLIKSNKLDKESAKGQRLISWAEIDFLERWLLELFLQLLL